MRASSPSSCNGETPVINESSHVKPPWFSFPVQSATANKINIKIESRYLANRDMARDRNPRRRTFHRAKRKRRAGKDVATVGRANEGINPVSGQRADAQSQQHRPQRGRHRAKEGKVPGGSVSAQSRRNRVSTCGTDQTDTQRKRTAFTTFEMQHCWILAVDAS